MKFIKNKGILIFGITILMVVFILSSCSKKTEDIPKDDSITLSYKLSNPAPKIGDQLIVTATLENVTFNDFLVAGSDPMVQILMSSVDNNSFSDVIAGTGWNTILKGHEKYTETKNYRIEKAGSYKITINSDFSISFKGSSIQKPYKLSAEPIEFEVSE